MKISQIAFVIYFIIFVYSCERTDNESVLRSQLTIVKAVEEVEYKIRANDFFRNIQIIPVENNDSLLISNLGKVEWYKEEYYTSVSKGIVMVFDMKGNLKREIGRIGSGPGEYAKMRDFEIDKENGEIIIYSPNDLSLFFYKTDGEFLRKLKLEFYGSGFEVMSGNRFGFYVNYNESEASGNYNLLITDNQGQILDREMPFSKLANRAVSFSGNFRSFNEDINLYSHAYSDTLWLLNKLNSPIRIFLFDFDGRQWNYGFDFERTYERESIDKSYLSKSYFMDENWLFATFLHKRRYRQAIYSIKSNETFNEQRFSNAFLFKILKTPRGKLNSNTFLTTINAQYYSGLKNSYPQEWELFSKTNSELVRVLEKMLLNEENPAFITFEIAD